MFIWVCLFMTLQMMLALSTGGCGYLEPEPVRVTEEHINDEVKNSLSDETGLPLLEADVAEEGPVAKAIYGRRSQRSFSQEPLDLPQVERLLWSAGGLSVDGVTGPTRAIPSAGGTYPLDTYLVAGKVEGLEPGIYRYSNLEGILEPVMSGDFRNRIAEAALGQGFIADAPAVIVLVAHFERTTRRYGERGERYVYMDAGYASQNIYLMAGELGMVTVAVGAFTDPAVADVIGTSGVPLMIMPVGYPSS